MTLLAIYDRLYARYGRQHWWPADTAFEIMVGAILTQNTAWKNVEKALRNLKQHQVLDAQSILQLSDADLAEWLRPSGYFNVKSRRLKNFCRWYVDNGAYESLARLDTDILRQALLSINGVGPETADDILLYAFARPVFVIDAYTQRTFTRLGQVDEGLSYESLRVHFEKTLSSTQSQRHGRQRSLTLARLYNEYHALIVIHGKDVCRSRPLCAHCCLKPQCAYYQHNF